MIALTTSNSHTKSPQANDQFKTNYEKLRTVGKGAFGTAILYRRMKDSKLVVLKEINIAELSPVEKEMALNEVEVLSVLHHPNIISYLGSFEVDESLIIEMEYADGGTLAQYISKAKYSIPELQILIFFKQIVSAIHYMHEHNILHRDLKTANIFLTHDNMVKVGDFGISKVMNTKSQAHTILGTPYYISPEMCEGKKYDQKSDIWALGCILYELACREKTFQGTNLPALVNKIMKGSYEPLPTVYSSSLKILVNDLLQKDPAMRPPTNVIVSRVNKLQEKAERRSVNYNFEHLSRLQLKQRSILYTLTGYGTSFSLVPINLQANTKIVSFSASISHYIAVTSDLLVYTWGDGKQGQLGLDAIVEYASEPEPVDSPGCKAIALAAAGNGFSVFVSDSGLVLTCGDGSSGCLGHGDWSSLQAPKVIESLSDVFVVDARCGDAHVIILTQDHSVYSWGSLPSERKTCMPEEIEFPFDSLPAVISAGFDASGVVTATGKLYLCGSNDDNKLGLNGSLIHCQRVIAKAKKFTLVRALSKWMIKDVSLGRSHTAVVTHCGLVITMGNNSEGQLGHNKTVPSTVRLMSDRFVTMACCGPTYTVAVTQENALYFWGTRFINRRTRTNSLESNVSMSTLETELVTNPQEILMLYATQNQIAVGIILKMKSVHPLWQNILVLVDTTAPLPTTSDSTEVSREEEDNKGENEMSDSIPDWIRRELEDATEEWPGEYASVRSSQGC